MSLRYLRCVSVPEGWGREHLIVQDVYAFHPHGDEWGCALSNRSTYYFSEGELRAHFEPATRADFEAALLQDMRDFEAIELEHRAITKELEGTNDLALHSGEVPATEEQGEVSSSTQLARPARKHPAAALRNKAHSLSRRINGYAESVKAKREVIESKLKQQLAMFQVKVAEMQEQVEKLTEVVHMVNLYLGRDEAITCLREGEPAPKGTPIAFRQNVLYMDEECALQESHGIDFTEVTKFDRWLLAKSEHLEQVIPNAKGVVVLQVRRSAKNDYAKDGMLGALASAQSNQENMRSYWLIRNGQRLHRIWTDVQVGPRLVPREDELDQFFTSREYNWDTKRSEQEVIRPGSAKFYEAMKEANAHRRHYMRLLLVLQGLLDRTKLFEPYANGIRPNLLDDATWEGQITFVRDTEMVIEDGEPAFDEWLSGVNKNLRAGLRIVGGHYPTFYDERRGDSPRTHPKNASAPEANQVYTLMDGPERSFKFLYDRHEKRWKRDYWRTQEVAIEKRASYRLERNDKFFICIDNVTDVAKMKYYLADRRHRKSYEHMIPVLRAAIAIKEKEAAEEQPFRELLMRKLTETHPDNPCTSERLEEIISWWKFKVKEHRPLLADDAKAYTMIMAEYGRQSSISPAELERQIEVMKSEGLARLPDAIAAWYKGDGKFIVLRAIEKFPAFVHQETWRVVKTVPVTSAREVWVLPVKSNYLRWRVILATPQWEAMQDSPSATKHLSGNQYPVLKDWVLANPPTGRFDDENQLLALYVSQGSTASVRVVMAGDPDASVPRQLLDRVSEHSFREVGVTWKVARGVYSFSYERLYSSATYDTHGRGMQWGWKSERAELLWLDEAKFASIGAEIAARAVREDTREAAEEWVRRADDSAEAYLEKQWRTAEQLKFLKDGGEPEFFDDHVKTLMKPKIDTEGLRGILSDAVNKLGAVQPLTGCTLAGALKQAGIQLKKPSECLRILVQSSWVLPQEKEGPDENE